MGDDVEVLTGGGVNDVVRVGTTVRRPTGPWSAQVHDLLRHLERERLPGVPRSHGTTPEGLEVLDPLPGEVCGYPVSDAAATRWWARHGRCATTTTRRWSTPRRPRATAG